APLDVIAHTRTFYDGEPFVGMPLGQLEAGAVTRTESLAIPDAMFAQVARPPLLDPDGATPWPPEYPAEYRARAAPLAGSASYAATAVPGSPGGSYAVTQRVRRDVRGLPVASRDALGAETTIAYDAFGLLPVEVTDPAGLATRATYDYRVLAPNAITDVNG